jgi:hypothetical protein
MDLKLASAEIHSRDRFAAFLLVQILQKHISTYWANKLCFTESFWITCERSKLIQTLKYAFYFSYHH